MPSYNQSRGDCSNGLGRPSGVEEGFKCTYSMKVILALFVIGTVVGGFILFRSVFKNEQFDHDLISISVPDPYCMIDYDCENCTDYQKSQGCCQGCPLLADKYSSSDQCGLNVQVFFNGIKPIGLPQRVWLFVSVDGITYYTTGFAPHVAVTPSPSTTPSTSPSSSVTVSPTPPFSSTPSKSGSTKRAPPVDDLDDPSVSTPSIPPVQRRHSPAPPSLSSSSSPSRIPLGVMAVKHVVKQGSSLTPSPVDTPFPTLEVLGYKGSSKGSQQTSVTNGCYGEAGNQVIIVACLSVLDLLDLSYTYFPIDLCNSTYGICVKTNGVIVQDMDQCTADGKWIGDQFSTQWELPEDASAVPSPTHLPDSAASLQLQLPLGRTSSILLLMALLVVALLV